MNGINGSTCIAIRTIHHTHTPTTHNPPSSPFPSLLPPSSPGGDALVSSGIMESLLQVLEWRAFEPTNITVSAVDGIGRIEKWLVFCSYHVSFSVTTAVSETKLVHRVGFKLLLE